MNLQIGGRTIASATPAHVAVRSRDQSSHLFTTLQAGRALAAILVVLTHATTIFGARLGHAPMSGFFSFGHIGVDFFFALSGFIITMAHLKDLGRSDRFRHFMTKRLIRIYPIYWVALTAVIAASASDISLGLTDSAGPLTFVRLVKSFLLLPDTSSPILSVAWTLRHEVLFYVLFGFAVLNRRLGYAIMASWIALIIAVSVNHPTSTSPWNVMSLVGDFLGSTYNLQFLSGIVAAVICLRCRVLTPMALVFSGAIGFVSVGLLENIGWITGYGQTERLLLAGFLPLLLIGGVVLERDGALKFGPIVLFLGAASYSIYLVHVPILFLAAGVPAIYDLPEFLIVLIVTATACGFGCLVHYFVERPITEQLKALT